MALLSYLQICAPPLLFLLLHVMIDAPKTPIGNNKESTHYTVLSPKESWLEN